MVVGTIGTILPRDKLQSEYVLAIKGTWAVGIWSKTYPKAGGTVDMRKQRRCHIVARSVNNMNPSSYHAHYMKRWMN
jgi:hypothetical protein